MRKRHASESWWKVFEKEIWMFFSQHAIIIFSLCFPQKGGEINHWMLTTTTCQIFKISWTYKQYTTTMHRHCYMKTALSNELSNENTNYLHTSKWALPSELYKSLNRWTFIIHLLGVYSSKTRVKNLNKVHYFIASGTHSTNWLYTSSRKASLNFIMVPIILNKCIMKPLIKSQFITM